MPNLSGSETTVLLILSAGFAVVGYLLSEADRRNLGRTPWGMPSLVWAFLWFLSLLLGVVLYLVAHRSEVKRAATAPVGMADGGPATARAPIPARSVPGDFPAYPRRADGGTPSGTRNPPPSPPRAPDVSPPAWHPDPGGRFQYRWWTGTEWTSFVATDGQVTVDTSPDQRIGPY